MKELNKNSKKFGQNIAEINKDISVHQRDKYIIPKQVSGLAA